MFCLDQPFGFFLLFGDLSLCVLFLIFYFIFYFYLRLSGVVAVRLSCVNYFRMLNFYLSISFCQVFSKWQILILIALNAIG